MGIIDLVLVKCALLILDIAAHRISHLIMNPRRQRLSHTKAGSALIRLERFFLRDANSTGKCVLSHS
jgi:hypothetical protein